MFQTKKAKIWMCISLLATTTVLWLVTHPSTDEEMSYPNTGATIDTLPLSFIANVGQSHPDILFTVRSLGGTLFFTPREILLNLANPNSTDNKRKGSTALSIIFEDSNLNPLIQGQDKRNGIVNYFLGNDPKHWYTNVPTYGSIHYTDLYPGIDLYYEGQEGQLKSTYVVTPQADPHQIGWQYQGARDVRLDKETGDLLIYLATSDSIVREQAPVAWQTIGNRREMVEVDYTMTKTGQVGFAVGAYDPAYSLIIDPIILAYSSYLGGTNSDWAEAITVDDSGHVYVSGPTSSDDFPTRNAYEDSLALCGTDIFVTKIDTTQSGDASLIYSTYLGGSGSCANDNGLGIAVDNTGQAYITGFVQANDFPTVNAYDATKGNGPLGDDTTNDAFLTKLNPTGNALLYSTFLGGDEGIDDIGHGIAVDSAGYAYVSGVTFSDDFPTRNAYQGSRNGSGVDEGDGFVTAFDTTQSDDASLIYSSYLGGSNNDVATGIATDDIGRVYISGRTDSTNFPLRNAYQGSYGGGNSDVFVTALDTTKSGDASLLYSSYLGGSGDDGNEIESPISYIGGITRDGAGQIYLTGGTQSGNFPTKNAYQSTSAGGYDVFIAKLDPTQSGDASLIYSTYLGGSSDDVGRDLVANDAGEVFVTGSAASTDFPAIQAYQSDYNGSGDAFVTAFDTAGTSLSFSTYLGGSQDDVALGIAVDSMDNVYLAGRTFSDDFPVWNAYDSSLDGGDGFVTKLGAVSIYLPVILRE